MVDSTKIVKLMQEAVEKKNNNYWYNKFSSLNQSGIHLAIMVEPYLSDLLCGKKTIESRFSINMIAPFRKVKSGDIVILKKSGGPIVGMFEATKIRFIEIKNSLVLDSLKQKYNERLLIEDDFWEKKKTSKYATLIDVDHVLKISPIFVHFSNRQSWVTLGKLENYRGVQMSIKSSNFNFGVICVVGEIASGKTQLSKTLSMSLGIPRFSISDYLRTVATENGYEQIDRNVLQNIGQKCIEEGWDIFVNNFISFTKWNGNQGVIFEGIRHVDFFNSLKAQISPSKCVLFYLDVSKNILQERTTKRGEATIDYAHPAEGSLYELMQISDCILQTDNKSEVALANEIISFIKNE